MRGCRGLHMNIQTSGGGGAGGETITWSRPADFFYLMFVHDYSNNHVHPLTSSGLRVALYSVSGQVARFNVPKVDPSENSRCRY